MRSTCCARPPTTLATEANGVSDNPLIFAETDEALSGGNFHAEPVAFAADMIALAMCEIGSLAERRIAMLVDPALSRPAGLPDAAAGAEFGLHDPAGDGRGAGLGEQAARLSGQRRFDPDLGQPGGPRLDGGARRAPAAADGRERRARGRRSSCWPPRRAATSTRRCAPARRSRRVRALLRGAGAASRRRPPLRPRHRRPPTDLVAQRRADRRGRRRPLPCLEDDAA